MLVPVLLSAQVSLYEFSQSVEPYTEITEAEAAYSLGVPVYWPPQHNLRVWVNNEYFGAAGQVTNGGYLSGVYGPGYPIGFDFLYNGDVFDRIGVSHQGWISFGKSSDGNQAVWSYAADHPHGRPFVQYIGGPDVPYKRNRVAGWGYANTYMQDLSSLVPPGPISSLYIGTVGTAPNRTCVIQFHEFMMGYPPTSSRINYQIRLNEADNSVEVRFGTIIISSVESGSIQIGLGGQIPEDFNNRKTVFEEPAFLYDFNYTVAGTSNTDGCYATYEQPFHPNGSGVPPEVGLTFKWTPDACPAPAWPLDVSDITFEAATVQWPATGASEYEYLLTDTNDVNGPAIDSGITEDPVAFFFGLDPSTTYYVFVRSICNGVPGTWSVATPFDTQGGGMVVCDGTAVTENYCSDQYSIKEWRYISDDGSPLKIEFLGGVVDNTGPEAYLKIWDDINPIGEGTSYGGSIGGQSFVASSGAMFIRLKTDVAACQAQDWYYPVEWRVGCKNCQDPLASYSTVEDCDNQQYSVAVDIFSMGSSASVDIGNSLGLAATTVTTTGTHMVGPFPAGQGVVITVQDPGNVLCYSISAPLLNAPCALVGCGPDTYTHCYGNNEVSQWAYQGEAGQEIGIRFIRGNVQYGDNLQSFNGLDIDDIQGINLPNNLANHLITSGPPSTDQALVLSLQSDNSSSCADGELPYGEWEYIVACYDGCTQPKANFTRACVSPTQFEVSVNITDMGSTPAVQITNNGGAPAVTATATGTYAVGPFPVDIPVTVEVKGASVLCTWTSSPLVKNTDDCLGTGIRAETTNELRLYPNPGNGIFHVEVPSTMTGTSLLQVRDLAGRTLSRTEVHAPGLHTLDLGELPSGYYLLSAGNGSITLNGTIIIQR